MKVRGIEPELTGNDTVGLSRQHTKEHRPTKRSRHVDEPADPTGDTMESLSTQKTVTATSGFLGGHSDELDQQRTITNGALFTEEELANALTASTLKPSRRERG